MTILSENLKTIRRHLDCTQIALSEVLGIGFRTYVRYEAGKRDVPVAVMVKLTRLVNIALDRLLTTPISELDLKIPNSSSPPVSKAKLDVIGGSLDEGRLVFKGIHDDFLISKGEQEKKLLGLYRKMDTLTREKYILDLEWLLKNARSNRKRNFAKKPSKKSQKTKNIARLKKAAKSL